MGCCLAHWAVLVIYLHIHIHLLFGPLPHCQQTHMVLSDVSGLCVYVYDYVSLSVCLLLQMVHFLHRKASQQEAKCSSCTVKCSRLSCVGPFMIFMLDYGSVRGCIDAIKMMSRTALGKSVSAAPEQEAGLSLAAAPAGS